MTRTPRVRDSGLIDAVELLPHVVFEGTVWRVTREGRDPCQCSSAGGRWDDASFDVLYTSIERDGAIAEMYFHLMRGQPVFPSKVRLKVHELRVSLKSCIRVETLDSLATLGLDTSQFGQLSYSDRTAEYPRSQEIAEAAHFLDCDGIIVPSARYDTLNVVPFCDRATPGAIEHVQDHGLIDWRAWAAGRK
jgi:RES domain-containing protein